jgi:serine/threonine protein kinase
MHEIKLFHLDLKPDNILVFELANNEFLFKLADFGEGK